MNDTVLEMRGAAHRYHGNAILDVVEIAVRRGEIVGICGPSGAGKSTFLRLAAGIERPTAGQVLADGSPMWPEGSSRATHPRPGWVGMVFQDPGSSLDPAWSIKRILTEPFRAAGRQRTSRHDRRAGIEAMLSHVGLADTPLASRPAQLSGGQQQRVALARCLLGTPSIVLADEPTSALDVTNAAGVMHLLRATADAGVAVVLVSHDRRMLGSIADRVLECRDGQIQMLDVVEAR